MDGWKRGACKVGKKKQLKVVRLNPWSEREGFCTGSLSSLPEIQWKILGAANAGDSWG